jgi:hypothetical protein
VLSIRAIRPLAYGDGTDARQLTAKDGSGALIPFLLLTFAFVVPLFDLRRPWRVVHADILVLVLSPLYFLRYMEQSAGSLRWAVVSMSAGLVYLFARLVLLGSRPAPPYRPLVTLVPVPVLAIATGALVATQIAFPLYDYRPVIDVGYSSVAGAEHILHGIDVYGPDRYSHPELHPDAYGPFDYVAYVPFAYLFSNAADAARAASDVFHLLTVVALFFLGRRLAPGTAGTRLGVTLSYTWAAYPLAFFVTVHAYNDMLVALCLVGAMLALSSAGRGAILGLGAAAKFVPTMVVPLFSVTRRNRPIRSSLVYYGFFAAAVVAVFTPFVPDGGLTELYHRTVGWQLHRTSSSSVWGQFPSLHWLRLVIFGCAVLVAIVVAAVPRRRTLFQTAALGGAVIAAFELSLRHLLPSYGVWFAPLALVAILGGTAVPRRALSHARESAGRRGPP